MGDFNKLNFPPVLVTCFILSVFLFFLSFLANVNSRSRSLYATAVPSVCRLSVTFVHPTQPVEIFGNFSLSSGTLAIHWHSMKILRRLSQGHPSGARGVAKYSVFSDFSHVRYMLLAFRLSICRLSVWYKNRWPWLTLNRPWTTKWLLFCVILTNLVVSGANCVKVVDKP